MADNFKYLQAQNFALSGSGQIIGDTSITLKSFKDIDGNLITMSSFGTIGFGTLEPGSGTLEEQISFTGVVQNASGTATLTGVSNVGFAYPYTKTSGLLKTHAGAVSFVISNTAGFYDNLVAKTDDETITGTYTFTVPQFPQVDNSATLPTLDGQFATKKYVDGVAVAGASNANQTTKGIVQLATRAQYDAGTLVGSTSAYLVVTPDILSSYYVDSGSPNVIVITPSPVISSYVAGQKFSVKLANSNTSPTVSININGVGAKSLIIAGGSPAIGNLASGSIIEVQYDGTNFQTLGGVSTASGTMQMFAGASASIPTGWLGCDGTSYLRATYPSLFSAIGTSYGTADGTHFNVPDMRGRVAVGAGTGTGGGASGTGAPTGGTALTAIALGTWKGEETHQLTVAELASHTHSVPIFTSGGAGSPATASGLNSGGVTTGSAGSDTAHNNIQPIMGVNYIIKV